MAGLSFLHSVSIQQEIMVWPSALRDRTSLWRLGAFVAFLLPVALHFQPPPPAWNSRCSVPKKATVAKAELGHEPGIPCTGYKGMIRTKSLHLGQGNFVTSMIQTLQVSIHVYVPGVRATA